MPPVTGATSGAVDPEVLNRLNTPQAADALRRGNVDEILKVTGISKKDWEDYLKTQSVSLNRDVVQDYQIYADYGSVPTPQWGDQFSPEIGIGKITAQDHQEFLGSLKRISGKAQVAGGKATTSGKTTTAPASLQSAVEGYTTEADNLLSSITDKALGMQLQMDYDKESEKIKQEFQALLANANDPETIIMALTQYKMRQAGLIMRQESTQVYNINKEQGKAMDALSGLDPSSPGYYAVTQKVQAHESQLGSDMQQHLGTMQTAMQNVESALNSGKSMWEEFSKGQDSITRNTSVKS